MKNRSSNFFSHQLNAVALILQILFIAIATMVFLALSATIIFFQWNQISRSYTPSIVSVSPANTSISAPAQTSQEEQILSEAQQDVTVANNIISWSGFFLAIIASAVTVAAFFGIREFIHIRNLSNDFRTQIHELTGLKEKITQDLKEFNKQIEAESRTLVEVAHNFSMATNAYKVGNNVGAVEYYLQAFDIQPENLLVLERLGRAYSNLNETDKALTYLNKALAKDASYVPALRSLALCYRYIDRDKAIDYFRETLKIDASDYETWDFLGLIYRDTKRFDDAIVAHEKALTLKIRPETQFYLSILYSIKGDVNRAKLMSLSAEEGLSKKEHSDRIRPIWKDLIRAGVHIIEGNESEAYKLVKSLSRYITTQRLYDGVTGHLTFLLESTGHETWKQKFISVLKVQ